MKNTIKILLINEKPVAIEKINILNEITIIEIGNIVTPFKKHV